MIYIRNLDWNLSNYSTQDNDNFGAKSRNENRSSKQRLQVCGAVDRGGLGSRYPPWWPVAAGCGG
jgi:hypothetical protein